MTRVAARPIRINRSDVQRLMGRIYKELGKLSKGREQEIVGNRPKGIVFDEITVQSVTGEKRRVVVALIAKRGGGSSVLGGGFGHHRRTRDPVLIIQMNGSYTWGGISNPKVSSRDLRSILMHELTHASDVLKKTHGDVQGRIPTREDIDLKNYYNDPNEVRALMRELYEEIRDIVHKVMSSRLGEDWGLGGTITRLLRTNQTWKEAKPHLTSKNRNRILKGLVTAFEDEGIGTSEGRVAYRWMARQAGLFEAPPRMVDEITEWVQSRVCSWLVNHGGVTDDVKYLARRCSDGSPPKDKERTTFYLDLKGWKYLRDIDRIIKQKVKETEVQITQAEDKHRQWIGDHEKANRLAREYPVIQEALRDPDGDAFWEAQDILKKHGITNTLRALEAPSEEPSASTPRFMAHLMGMNPSEEQKLRPISVLRKQLRQLDMSDPAKVAMAALRASPKGFTSIDVVLDFGRYGGSTAGEYKPDRHTLTIYGASGLPRWFSLSPTDRPKVFRYYLDDIMEVVDHELTHMAQDLLSVLHGLKSMSAGLPGRGLRDPEWSPRGVYKKGPGRLRAPKPHALLDVEFYTRLKDEVKLYKKVIGDIPLELRDHARRIWIGAVKGPLEGYKIGRRSWNTTTFFSTLKKSEPRKWRKAVSEFIKATNRETHRTASRYTVLSPQPIPGGKVWYALNAAGERIGSLTAGPITKSRYRSRKIYDDQGNFLGYENMTIPYKDDKVWKVLEVFVEPRLRRKGIATMMYNAAFKWAQSKGIAFGSGWIVSQKALRYWEKLEQQGKAKRTQTRHENPTFIRTKLACSTRRITSNLLKPTGQETFMGGLIYQMDVKRDSFVHFTTKSRAQEILSSGRLQMDPPYKKSGIDAVNAVSVIWGRYVPGVQTTHLPQGEKHVALQFTTSTVPEYGYREEVIWKRDVVFRKMRVLPLSRGISMLRNTPETIGDQDMVVYR